MDNFSRLESSFSNLHGGGVPRMGGRTGTGVRWSAPYPYYGYPPAMVEPVVLAEPSPIVLPIKQPISKEQESKKSNSNGLAFLGVVVISLIIFGAIKSGKNTSTITAK